MTKKRGKRKNKYKRGEKLKKKKILPVKFDTEVAVHNPHDELIRGEGIIRRFESDVHRKK